MTYNPQIPQPTDRISTSQGDLLANFQQLEAQYGTNGDHIEWTATTDNGKHKRSTYIDQTASPPITAGFECASYARTAGNQTNLYARRNGITTLDYPLMPVRAMVNVNAANTQLGVSFNINTTAFAGNTWTITFATPEPDTNYLVLASPVNGTTLNGIVIRTITVNSFQIVRGAGVDQIHVVVMRYSL